MRKPVESGFFNTYKDDLTGKLDREYSSAQFRELFSLFFTNGIFVNYGKEFAVTANGTMEITVNEGFAFINGAWAKNAEPTSFTIPNNETAQTRVDGIFIQSSTLERNCAIVYKEGVVEPETNEATHELLLCTVSIESNSYSVTQASVTDMRPTKQCGFVGGAVQQMDVSEMYTQFAQQFTEWMEGEQERFNAWYENIKNQLSEDAAGNLQLQVDDLVTDVDNVRAEVDEKFVVVDNVPSTLEAGKFYFVY